MKVYKIVNLLPNFLKKGPPLRGKFPLLLHPELHLQYEGPKSVTNIFGLEIPPPPWKCSENSSVLVLAWPAPKCENIAETS